MPIKSLLLTLCMLSTFSRANSIYEKRCAPCHGLVGQKRFLFSKKLNNSTLPDSLSLKKIQYGGVFMPSFDKKISLQEALQLVEYIKTFREAQ